MKKKPELFKRTGKSSLTLRNFLNNLKENDLHYENKQITQCVFLGVLRLKPVPSIFSKNNVPSVSAPAEHNKPKRIRNNNSNKEQNKNVSRKSDINKVLSGKVSKKNPQKVKAAVKKVPDKKSTIKIKLHTKKKTSKVKKTVHSSPTDKQETVTVSSESSQTVICDPVLVRPSIGLNPMMSPSKFNPVQNLFDKLKQKIDSRYGEPGPSTVSKQTNKTVDSSRSPEENSKVCKINAKRQVNPSVNANKKSKKVMHRKPINYERLSMPLQPTSPITVSDSDSTGKKDDIIVIDGNNFSNSQQTVEQINVDKTPTEDIIFVNEDPKPVKQKERTSPRNKSQEKEAVSGSFEKHGFIIINEEQKSTKAKRQSPPKSNETSHEAQQKQSSEVIIISECDEAKTKVTRPVTNKKAKSNVVENMQEGAKNDVIVIDELRELRVSPRLKNVEILHENHNEIEPSTINLEEQVAAVDEVIVINEETQTTRHKMQNLPKKSSAEESKTQELNITIDDQQNVKNKDKPSSRLLKIVNKDENLSVTVKKELIESYNESDVIVISEKPRQRKMKLKPPLIPPMFLNAPMLLRSELAPKKTVPAVNFDKPKIGKRRERSTSKLLRSDLEHTKNPKYSILKLNEKNSSSILKPQEKSSKKKGLADSVSILSSLQTGSGSEEVIFVANEKSSTRALKPSKLEKAKRKDVQEINLVAEESCSLDSLHGSVLVEKTCQEPSRSIGNNYDQAGSKDDVIVVSEDPIEEEIAEKTLLTDLRSEGAQHKSPDNLKETAIHFVDPVEDSSQRKPKICKQRDEDVVIVKYEVKPNDTFTPRLLRSDLTKQKIFETDKLSEPAEEVEEKAALKKEPPKLLVSDQTITEIIPQEKDSINVYEDVEISAPQENPIDTQPSPDNSSNVYAKKSVAESDEEVTIIKEEPKPNEKASQRTLRSDIAELIKLEKNNSDEVLIIDNDEKTSPRETAQQKVRTKSPQKNKQIDLDEIIVVNEKRAKKSKERTISGRLLRSELALLKSRELVPIKTEVEEVVVLIHDEPKPRQKASSKCVVSQKRNKKIHIQEEVIVLADDTQSNKKTSPRSLRSDAGQKRSPENIPTKVEVKKGKRISLLRSLRSEQNLENVSKEESIASAQKVEKDQTPRSGIACKKSPQAMPKNHESHEAAQVSSSRSLRSLTAQPSLKNVPLEKSTSPVESSDETQSLERTEIVPRKSPRTKDQPDVVEDKQTKLPISPRLLRSQHSPRNMLDESKNPVEKQKLTKADISKKSSRDVADDICDVTENVSSSRLLRSIAAKSSPEQSESPVKAKGQSPRLLRSENTSKIPDTITIDQTCDLTEECTVKSEPDSLRLLRSDIVSKENCETQAVTPKKVVSEIGILKSPPKKLFGTSEVTEVPSEVSQSDLQSEYTEDVDNPSPENMSRSDIAPKKSPSGKKSDEPALVGVKKKGKSPFRKTKSLLVDSKTKLKTPMLLRSELAQLKSIDVDCPNQKKEPKTKQKKKGRRSKSAPAHSTLEVPVPEPTPSVQTTKVKTSKRKSLIDDLKRKQEPKQKPNVMKNPKRSPETIPEPEQTSEELPEIQSVSENSVSTVSPSSVETGIEIAEKPTQNPSKLSSKTQGALKSTKSHKKDPIGRSDSNNKNSAVTPRANTEEISQDDNTERPIKRKAKAQEASKSVSPKMATEEIPQEKPPEQPLKSNVPKNVEPKIVEENSLKNPLKRKSDSRDAPKNIMSKLSKNTSTPTKSTSTSPKNVEACEKSSPREKRKRLLAKRKSKVTKPDESVLPPEPPVVEEAKINKTPEASKPIDTTVFDFDETEPEVVPLRLNSPRKDKSVKLAPENAKELRPSRSNLEVTPKPKKQKSTNKTNVDDSKTKAHAKAKLLAMLGDKSPQTQTNNTEPPEKPKGKSTKTKSASKTKAENDKSSDIPLSSPKQVENTKKASDKTNASPSKTSNSPMKQTTITDMFNKALVKKEKANLAETVFGPPSKAEDPLKKNAVTDMAPPKAEKKITAPAKDDEEENDLYDDDEDDSDCESRVEWMPEEYAEYKFKYSAKKMMSYKPIHKCKICLLILPSYYKLKRHKKEHAKKPNPYNCTQCDQAFPSIEDLTAHLRIHKGKHPYTCKKCDIGFWSKKLLDDHTPIHVLRKVKQSNKRFRCDVCAKEFGKLCDMERHTRVHTGEKPCVCNICNKRFQQSHNLSKHLLTHLHVKPYHCEICNKQFGRNDVLNRHLLTHSVDKPIKCPLCPKGFIRQTQLKNHMKKNHPDAAKIDAMAETNVEAN